MNGLQLSITEPLIVYDLVFATRRSQLTGIERYAINMFCASAQRAANVVGIVADASLLPANLPIIETAGFVSGWFGFTRYLTRKRRDDAVLICACAPASPSMLLSDIPVARIIHDDFAWSRSETLSFAGRRLFRDYERLMLRRDDLIFSPTDIARTELAHTLGRSDIRLAGNAPGISLDGPGKRRAELDEKLDFILMVGTVEPRKNYERVVGFLESDFGSQFHIVVAGRRGWHGSAAVLDRAVAHGRVTWLEDVSDDELRWLYRHCCGFLTLSHAEGFNMPLVEAGIAGCPILCSDLPIHRSVAPNWARFIPVDVDNEMLGFLLREQPASPNEIDSYRARFSWEAVADAVERPLIALWQGRRQ